MPQRFLRPGITNSERWNSLDWPAQSFFIRILTLVDDFGRFDGRSSVLHGHCWAVWNHLNPKKTAAVNLQQVEQMLQQLAATRVISLYDHEKTGRRFLQVEQWQERIRKGCVSKWPDPHDSCSKLLQDVRELQQVAAEIPPSSPSPTPSEDRAPSSTPPPTVPQGGQADGISDSETPIGFDEAKLLLNALFGREKRKWSYEEDQLLAAVLPITRAEWPMIEAWFRLPLDHAVFQVTKRKHELTTFLRDFNGELDKMRAHASLFRSAVSAPEKKKEPPLWREFFQWKYGPDVRLPKAFRELPDDQRAEYARDFANFEKEKGGAA